MKVFSLSNGERRDEQSRSVRIPHRIGYFNCSRHLVINPHSGIKLQAKSVTIATAITLCDRVLRKESGQQLCPYVSSPFPPSTTLAGNLFLQSVAMTCLSLAAKLEDERGMRSRDVINVCYGYLLLTRRSLMKCRLQCAAQGSERTARDRRALLAIARFPRSTRVYGIAMSAIPTERRSPPSGNSPSLVVSTVF